MPEAPKKIIFKGQKLLEVLVTTKMSLESSRSFLKSHVTLPEARDNTRSS